MAQRSEVDGVYVCPVCWEGVGGFGVHEVGNAFLDLV